MNVVYSFIGKLPDYTYHSIKQLRNFYDGDVYLILDDLNSEIIESINQFNIKLISYDLVKSVKFDIINSKCGDKFAICNWVKDRELLFMRSFERFYILEELMKKYSLKDVLFLEIDNTIYFDPMEYIIQFKQKGLSYMFDNIRHCSSGISYIRDVDSLTDLTSFFSYWIPNSNYFVSEMGALYDYFINNKSKVQLLPVLWNDIKYPEIAHSNYNKFSTIFDAFAIGVYMFGLDSCHTNGKIITGQKSKFSMIDYTPYTYKWEKDEKNRNIPYILSPSGYVRVNNLHIHSKDLKSAMS
jgi:hypothetical protein